MKSHFMLPLEMRCVVLTAISQNTEVVHLKLRTVFVHVCVCVVYVCAHVCICV